MTTADLSGPTEEPNPTHASAVQPAGWLLRATALTAVVAGAAAVIVLPGARGNASEHVVVWADIITAALTYFLLGLLVLLIIWGAVELARIRSSACTVAINSSGSIGSTR